nr:hypothetical protein [uncultured Flavobacterium sp.]
MEKEVYLSELKDLLNAEKFDFFEEELLIISDVFYVNEVEVKLCFNFFKLILETRNLLYKYNLHLVYEPFNSNDTKDKNWQCFKITDGVQTKLEVFYNSNYSFMRIEDNISALYF